ncbi:MAG: MTH938/NDUFAF3 family protein [Anaerolineales bacterium]|jgi:hypothetical protein
MVVHHIDQYQFGEVIIDGVSYTRDLIILPSGIIPNWWRDEGHLLKLDDLKQVLEVNPKFLVIGIGESGRMKVSRKVKQALQAAGIGWTALPTGEACQEFNLRAAEQGLTAVLHLTC